METLRQRFYRREIENGDEQLEKEIEGCWERIRVLWEMVDTEREKSVRAEEEVKRARLAWDEGIKRMELNVDSVVGQMMLQEGGVTDKAGHDVGIEEIIGLLEKSREIVLKARETSF